MDFGVILLGLVGLAIVLAFIRVVSRIVSERESAARRKQVDALTANDDTITYSGHS